MPSAPSAVTQTGRATANDSELFSRPVPHAGEGTSALGPDPGSTRMTRDGSVPVRDEVTLAPRQIAVVD